MFIQKKFYSYKWIIQFFLHLIYSNILWRFFNLLLSIQIRIYYILFFYLIMPSKNMNLIYFLKNHLLLMLLNLLVFNCFDFLIQNLILIDPLKFSQFVNFILLLHNVMLYYLYYLKYSHLLHSLILLPYLSFLVMKLSLKVLCHHNFFY